MAGRKQEMKNLLIIILQPPVMNDLGKEHQQLLSSHWDNQTLHASQMSSTAPTGAIGIAPESG